MHSQVHCYNFFLICDRLLDPNKQFCCDRPSNMLQLSVLYLWVDFSRLSNYSPYLFWAYSSNLTQHVWCLSVHHTGFYLSSFSLGWIPFYLLETLASIFHFSMFLTIIHQCLMVWMVTYVHINFLTSFAHWVKFWDGVKPDYWSHIHTS